MKPGQDFVPPAQQDPTQPRPDVIRLDKVEPSVVRWLWESRIALGKLTLIAGDPGLGKSFLTLDLCARVSTGAAFPGERYADGRPMDRLPGVAILLSAEDDPADTIRPRLEAAGADLRRVALVRGVKTVGPDRAFNLRTDIGYLRGMCKAEPETKLIVIDPISAYLGEDEGNSNTRVRHMLAPLAKIAQDFDIAVIAVTHLNKGGGTGPSSALYRTMGSLAFTAAARTVHLVARDTQGEDRRLMLPVKNNLGQDRKGWGFALAENDATGHTAINWDEHPTPQTADELLSQIAHATGEGRSSRPSPALDAAVAFLKEQLAQGPVRVKDINHRAADHGISDKTLRNARETLRLQCQRQTHLPESPWAWSLPPDESDAPA